MLNGISQPQKDKSCAIPLTGGTPSTAKLRQKIKGYLGERRREGCLMSTELQLAKTENVETNYGDSCPTMRKFPLP